MSLGRENFRFDNDARELISGYDYFFFFEKNCSEEGYDKADLDEFYDEYEQSLKNLQSTKQKKPEQFYLLLDGRVRAMYEGGYLTGLFMINSKIKEFNISDFKSAASQAAIFETWKRLYRRKLTSEKIWGYVTKIGAILAICLTIVKLGQWIADSI